MLQRISYELPGLMSDDSRRPQPPRTGIAPRRNVCAHSQADSKNSGGKSPNVRRTGRFGTRQRPHCCLGAAPVPGRCPMAPGGWKRRRDITGTPVSPPGRRTGIAACPGRMAGRKLEANENGRSKGKKTADKLLNPSSRSSRWQRYTGSVWVPWHMKNPAATGGPTPAEFASVCRGAPWRARLRRDMPRLYSFPAPARVGPAISIPDLLPRRT